MRRSIALSLKRSLFLSFPSFLLFSRYFSLAILRSLLYDLLSFLTLHSLNRFNFLSLLATLFILSSFRSSQSPFTLISLCLYLYSSYLYPATLFRCLPARQFLNLSVTHHSQLKSASVCSFSIRFSKFVMKQLRNIATATTAAVARAEGPLVKRRN